MTTQIKPPEPATFPVHPEPVAAWQDPPESAAVTTPESHLPTREKRKFTVAEYYRMAEVGILHHTERVELLDGEIIVMAPIGEPHATVVDRLTLAFAEVSRGRFIVRVQNPIRLDAGAEPQPDLALLRRRADFYINAHPGPSDVLVVMEVSDSTLDFDREVKSKRYAAAGIPEMWVMNLPGDCLDRLDQPGPAGYARHTVFRRGDKSSPAALPDLEFAVADLLPPRTTMQGTARG